VVEVLVILAAFLQPSAERVVRVCFLQVASLLVFQQPAMEPVVMLEQVQRSDSIISSLLSYLFCYY